MKTIKIKNSYIFIFIGMILFIALSLFGLNNYSYSLRKDGQRELFEIKNRKAAIAKIRFAQTVWPLLKFDKSYQKFLGSLNDIEKRPAIYINLKESASTEDINTLITELQNISGVKLVKLISKEEALKVYKETNKSEPLLLKIVQPNILPRSIEVYLDDFTVRNQVEQTAKGKIFVSAVDQSL